MGVLESDDGTMSANLRLLLLLGLGALCLVQRCDALRRKPDDWDEEVDGTWDPTEHDSAPTPPPPEQYLSQEPDAWKNTPITTRLWEVISKNDVPGLEQMIKVNPRVVHARSEDGRGPLFWAYEYQKADIVKMLEGAGVDNTLKDKHGMTPKQMAPHQEL